MKFILPAFLNLGTEYPSHFWTSPVLSTSVEDAQGRFTDNSCPGIWPDCADPCAKDLSPLSTAGQLCCIYSCANTPVIPCDLTGTASCAKECFRVSQWHTLTSPHPRGLGCFSGQPSPAVFAFLSYFLPWAQSWPPTHLPAGTLVCQHGN